MKHLLTSLVVLALATACSKKGVMDMNDMASGNQQDRIARETIDSEIKSTVERTGRFDWNQANEKTVWSALQHGDNVMAIGYQAMGFSEPMDKVIHRVNINEPAWQNARQMLLQTVLAEERTVDASLDLADVEAYEENILPILYVRVNSLSTIAALRKSPLVRYAEPIGYEPQNMGLGVPDPGIAQASSSGCGSNVGEAGLTEPADFVTISPGAKQSWNYTYHNIPSAWGKSSGTGRRVMIIDTGLSPDQSLFSTLFNSGLSAGRTIERRVTLRKPGFLGFGYGDVETSTADACGHGTSMAGACASPRNASGGMVGVAYNVNLMTVRAAVDVMIDESRETKGVADAFVLAGNTASVNIVSMSMGRITSASSITDGVNYAFNKGKLIFCAAGTSFSFTGSFWGVIFPAWLSNVNAVTGIKDNLTTRCDACHQGNEVDFVVVMEIASNGRKPLSTAQSGLAPSTVGGSSVATATTAGIAALVWARNPTLTRDQVRAKLEQSSNYYPSRNSNFGWGRINADAATN
jgi:hypothetical protein